MVPLISDLSIMCCFKREEQMKHIDLRLKITKISNQIFRIIFPFLLITSNLNYSIAAEDKSPCRDPRISKSNARKDLETCLRLWAKAVIPEERDPSDDCSSKLASFIKSTRDLKSCRAELKRARGERKSRSKEKDSAVARPDGAALAAPATAPAATNPGN